jgi:dihydrodipicolinate synthase/N-acetylneuraminate lyase
MNSLITLPPIWPLQPGEPITPAHEAAEALVDVIAQARADAMPVLAQLGASDATPEAIALALRVQGLLADALVLAEDLVGNLKA